MADWSWISSNRNCAGTNIDTFFPTGTTGSAAAQIQEAKSVCRGCPVQTPCLEHALANGEVGVWGGTTDDERRVLRRGKKAS